MNAFARVGDPIRTRTFDLNRHLVRARDRAFERALTRDRIRALDRGLASLRTLDYPQDPDLADALRRASVCTGELLRELEALTPVSAGSGVSVPRPVRAARGLAQAAVRVLPAGQRCRYRDEYASELYELAAASTPRWRQALHALRLLDRAWVLRAELRAPAAGRAAP